MTSTKFLINNVLIIGLSLIFSSESFTQNKNYKGAEVYGKSPYDILYGKIEVRMLAAKGGGILSTFFTWKEGSEQSNVFWEEIDVEIFGKNNATTWQSNIITGLNPRQTSEQVHNHSNSLANDYHTYSVEWTPEYVSWYFDGQLIRKNSSSAAADLNSPAGIRFNLWASTSSMWAGTWNDNVLPQYQFVNWIKYYRYENDNFILDWIDDFTEFNNTRWGKANWTFDENRVDFDPLNIVVQDGMLVLCITKSGETGFNGTVPHDSTDISTGIKSKANNLINFNLDQNYPNPFNPSTIIKYSISIPPHPSPYQGEGVREGLFVSLKIFDILGREVATLVNEKQRPGNYEVEFSSKGGPPYGGDTYDLTSGIYFYRLQVWPTKSGVYPEAVGAGKFSQTRKMIFMK